MNKDLTTAAILGVAVFIVAMTVLAVHLNMSEVFNEQKIDLKKIYFKPRNIK